MTTRSFIPRGYQEAAHDCATAPAMEPYEPCVPCLQWIAAALAYQQAAALQTWAAAAPVTSYDSYQPDQDSGRGGGLLGKITNVVGKVTDAITAATEGAAGLASKCVGTETCRTSVVGLAVLGCMGGSGGSATAACIAGGSAYLAYEDGKSCANSPGLSCGAAVLDVAGWPPGEGLIASGRSLLTLERDMLHCMRNGLECRRTSRHILLRSLRIHLR